MNIAKTHLGSIMNNLTLKSRRMAEKTNCLEFLDISLINCEKMSYCQYIENFGTH